jgi:hypothetical protein
MYLLKLDYRLIAICDEFWRLSTSAVHTYSVDVIPLPEFKKLLGPALAGLSDEEVERIREVEDRLADIVFEMWLQHRGGSDSKAAR